jgi:hypothetical protein
MTRAAQADEPTPEGEARPAAGSGMHYKLVERAVPPGVRDCGKVFVSRSNEVLVGFALLQRPATGETFWIHDIARQMYDSAPVFGGRLDRASRNVFGETNSLIETKAHEYGGDTVHRCRGDYLAQTCACRC